uniref:Uncharacterized protein n=1 Tax=Avena sativa TaxID=4498 RepID=A0ACD5U9N7_AVESA
MAAGSNSAAEERHDEVALELSLRLRTGSSSSSGSSAAAEEEAAAAAVAAARRRSMTIFYNGRVCAVDVTEQQARTIITMANHQILTQQQQQRRDSDRHLQLEDSTSSSNNNNAAAHCRGAPAPQRPAPSLVSSPHPHHQGLIGAAEGTVVSHAAAAGLSMKRSLQQFLQKRKTRVAAVGSPYAGARPTRNSAMHS